MKNNVAISLGFMPLIMIACLVFNNTPKIIDAARPTPSAVSTAIAAKTSSPIPEYPGLIVFPNIKMEYYDIQGSTAQELLDEMYENGPIAGFESYRSSAALEYDLLYTWPGKSLGDCDLNKAETRYELKVIAPRWKPYSDVSPELVENWVRYIAKVRAHEEEHIKIVRNYFALLNETIANSTCLAASDAAAKVEQDLNRAQEKFDREAEPIIFP